MNASTYLKLADAARQFIKRDDIFQAMDAADGKSGIALKTAIGIMPEAMAEIAVLALNLTRCAMIESFSDLEPESRVGPTITGEMLQTGKDVAP